MWASQALGISPLQPLVKPALRPLVGSSPGQEPERVGGVVLHITQKHERSVLCLACDEATVWIIGRITRGNLDARCMKMSAQQCLGVGGARFAGVGV
ncbi:hypothetical protein PLESTM_000146800 [Pleodorina starrii]|nr:hypothetical protein PLESTM_000146800 [Pleodorina starrii]